MTTTEATAPKVVNINDVNVPEDMIPVENSSNILAIGYDLGLQRLFVRFSPTSLYAFEAVQPNVWEIFKGAPSKGRYFASDIKGKYQSLKLVAPQS